MKIAAEILVKCGYAVRFFEDERGHLPAGEYFYVSVACDNRDFDEFPVEPFDDTLEGRRQADAIEMYFIRNQWVLWAKSGEVCMFLAVPPTVRNYTLDRIKWCLEQMKPLEGGDRDE